MEKFGGGGDDDDFASSFTESFASTTPIRPSAYKRGREGRSGATAASEREMAEERDLFLLLLAHAIACDDLAIQIQLYGPSLVPATKHESPVDLKPPRENRPAERSTMNRVRSQAAALILRVQHHI